jgi:hypothetical protein
MVSAEGAALTPHGRNIAFAPSPLRDYDREANGFASKVPNVFSAGDA